MRTHLDLQKTFPDIPCVSQILGGPSLRLGIARERLTIPPGFWMRWEKRRLTGNVGISTAKLIQHPENLSNRSYNQFHSIIPESCL